MVKERRRRPRQPAPPSFRFPAFSRSEATLLRDAHPIFGRQDYRGQQESPCPRVSPSLKVIGRLRVPFGVTLCYHVQPAPSFLSGASPNEQSVRLNELHRGFFLTLSNDSSSSCSSQDGCSPRGALLPSLVRCQEGLPSSQMCHSSRPLWRYSSVFLSCALHRFGLAR